MNAKSNPFAPVDPQSIIDALHDFGVVYGREITPRLIQVYWDQLKHLDQQAFNLAVKYVHAHDRFFPPPSAFLAAERRQWI